MTQIPGSETIDAKLFFQRYSLRKKEDGK